MAPRKVKLDYAFNKVNPAAVKWARTRAAELIDSVTTTTKELISDTISDIFEGKTTWEQAHEDLMEVFDDEARVRTIAHTESMWAANEGQKELWAQAVEDGLLDGDEMQVWIVTPDDKLCPICEEQDGMTVPIGEEFPTGGPPAHPNCRCTIGLQ
jgi:hypothetical protein